MFERKRVPPGKACAIASAVLLMGLVGCAGSPQPAALSTGPTSFEGPWAGEFKDAYDESTDPFVRAVLADGKITDQEHAEMIDKFISCMAEGGVTMKPDTSYSFPESMGPDAAHEVDKRCTRESGDYPIGALYSIVQRNPDHLDSAEIIVACVVKKGALPPSYTPDDFARDNETQSYPYLNKDTGPAIMDACTKDPLGLLK